MIDVAGETVAPDNPDLPPAPFDVGGGTGSVSGAEVSGEGGSVSGWAPDPFGEGDRGTVDITGWQIAAPETATVTFNTGKKPPPGTGEGGKAPTIKSAPAPNPNVYTLPNGAGKVLVTPGVNGSAPVVQSLPAAPSSSGGVSGGVAVLALAALALLIGGK